MWTSEDDIALIKGNDWPCGFALPVKRPIGNSGNYEFGCITPDNRMMILATNLYEFNPFAKVHCEYESVEELVADGWMVD